MIEILLAILLFLCYIFGSLFILLLVCGLVFLAYSYFGIAGVILVIVILLIL